MNHHTRCDCDSCLGYARRPDTGGRIAAARYVPSVKTIKHADARRFIRDFNRDQVTLSEVIESMTAAELDSLESLVAS